MFVKKIQNSKYLWIGFLLYLFYNVGFPCGSAGKESTCNAGDLGLIPGLERSPGEGKGYPLLYCGLENPIDCMCIVHGVTKSWTRLSGFHFHFAQCNPVLVCLSLSLQWLPMTLKSESLSSSLQGPISSGSWQPPWLHFQPLSRWALYFFLTLVLLFLENDTYVPDILCSCCFVCPECSSSWCSHASFLYFIQISP